MHAKLGREKGKVTANIAVRLLRAMFNKATEWDLWDKPNPAKGVKRFTEHSRERFLQPDELPRFFQALADEPNETIRGYLLVPLLGEAVDILKRRRPDEHNDDKPYVFGGPGERGHLIEPKKGWRRVLDCAELYQLTDWIAEEEGWTREQIAHARAGADHRKALREARAAVKVLGKDPGAARIHDLRRTLGSWQAATAMMAAGGLLPMA